MRFFFFLFLSFVSIQCQQKQTAPNLPNEVKKDKTVSLDTQLQDAKIESQTMPPKDEVYAQNQKEATPTKTTKSNTGKEKIEAKTNVNVLKSEKVIQEKPDIRPEKKQVIEEAKNITNQPDAPKDSEVKQLVHSISHDIFDALLKKYVGVGGKVDYKGFIKERKKLDGYVEELASVQNIHLFPYTERLAFWINLYNAATIQLICDHYPVKSIRDIEGGKPWDKRFIKVQNTFYTLNEIEHQILRKTYGEPRIHFVVNCAAVSCPPLDQRAITAKNVYTVMEARTKSFINGSENQLSEKALTLSAIFDWYRDDFGDLPIFIGKYSPIKFDTDVKISFKSYNWALHE